MKKKTRSKNEVGGFLKTVERIGNTLPHPAIIFVIMSLILVVIAEILARFGVSFTYYDAKAGKEVELVAISLLNRDGINYIFNSAVKNYTDFAPLGTVLVAMLGVGVAEHSGLFEVGLKKLLTNVNSRVLTATVVFAGVMSNIASDAGYVVVIPLGAMMFASAGRHPIAGLAAAFAGVSAGFSANLAIGTTDPLLTGITNEALKISGSTMSLAPTC
ncbi:MAG: AbgT family transporter, partial [Treponemataceae bacterium]